MLGLLHGSGDIDVQDHYSYSIWIQNTSCYYSSSLNDLDLLLHIHIIIGKFSSLSKKMNSEAASGTILLVFVKPFSLFALLPIFFFLVQDVAYLETVGCWENVLRKIKKNRSWKKLENLITHQVHVYILTYILHRCWVNTKILLFYLRSSSSW